MFEIKKKHQRNYKKYTLDNYYFHKFNKIMLLSYNRLKEDKYRVLIALNYVFSDDYNSSLILTNIDFNLKQFTHFIKQYEIGIWYSTKNFVLNKSIIYIYKDLKNNTFVFKSTKHDNNLFKGFINQYKHKLLFKAKIDNDYIAEYVR